MRGGAPLLYSVATNPERWLRQFGILAGRTPPGSKRRQVRERGVLGRSLTRPVVGVPAAAVLVRNRTPTPIWQWVSRNDAGFHRIDTLRANLAQMRPVVTKIEDIQEPLARLQAAQADLPVVEPLVGIVVAIWRGETRVRQFEFVQMRPIPPCEGIVDRGGKLCEGMRSRGREDTARSRPEVLAAPFDQIEFVSKARSCSSPPYPSVCRPQDRARVYDSGLCLLPCWLV